MKLQSPEAYYDGDNHRFSRYSAIAPGMHWSPIMDGTFSGDAAKQADLRNLRLYVLGLCERILSEGSLALPTGEQIVEISYAGAWEIFGRANANSQWVHIPQNLEVPEITYP